MGRHRVLPGSNRVQIAASIVSQNPGLWLDVIYENDVQNLRGVADKLLEEYDGLTGKFQFDTEEGDFKVEFKSETGALPRIITRILCAAADMSVKQLEAWLKDRGR